MLEIADDEFRQEGLALPDARDRVVGNPDRHTADHENLQDALGELDEGIEREHALETLKRVELGQFRTDAFRRDHGVALDRDGDKGADDEGAQNWRHDGADAPHERTGHEGDVAETCHFLADGRGP